MLNLRPPRHTPTLRIPASGVDVKRWLLVAPWTLQMARCGAFLCGHVSYGAFGHRVTERPPTQYNALDLGK
jgi:hypothetical protein